jgi:hypothetical protein
MHHLLSPSPAQQPLSIQQHVSTSSSSSSNGNSSLLPVSFSNSNKAEAPLNNIVAHKPASLKSVEECEADFEAVIAPATLMINNFHTPKNPVPHSVPQSVIRHVPFGCSVLACWPSVSSPGL